MTAVGRRSLDYSMDMDEFLLQVAPQGAEAFGLLERGENAVRQHQFRFLRRYGKAQAREVMELAESSGESRLASVVRPGDHDDALGRAEVEVVGHHAPAGRTGQGHCGGEGEVESALCPHPPGRSGQGRVAKQEAVGPQELDKVEIGKVKLGAAFELRYGRVEKALILAEISVEGAERPGIEASDDIEHLCLDAVHTERAPELGGVVGGRVLPEPGGDRKNFARCNRARRRKCLRLRVCPSRGLST